MMDAGFKFHHIGYAVQDIIKTAKYYLNAGWSLTDIQYDLTQNTKIAFLVKENIPLIELVAPIDETSPIIRTLEKSGITPYHICYEVDDIEKSIQKLINQRFIKLFEPVEAIALDNRKICYLYNRDVGLIEILSK